jgi:hypothetical protein
MICFLTLLVSCETCTDQPKIQLFSPDHKIVARIFERNCGATTDYSSIVNIQGASEKFRGDDSILFIARGRYDISISWESPKMLLIKCPDCSRTNVYREVVALGNVDVTYLLGTDTPPRGGGPGF